jgi:hypothetical protein
MSDDALSEPRAISAPYPPEFLDHAGLARQLSCSITTVHKLRREGVIGQPCQNGGNVRWHNPTVRHRILARAAFRQVSAGDPFLERLNGSH